MGSVSLRLSNSNIERKNIFDNEILEDFTSVSQRNKKNVGTQKNVNLYSRVSLILQYTWK
jgi:hypothetical protein